eukprot:gene48976-65663_t
MPGPWSDTLRIASFASRSARTLTLTTVPGGENLSALSSRLASARLAAPRPAPSTSSERPFRLAYAGLPVAHKGWPLFMSLAARFGSDPRYEFIHLGARRDPAMPYRFIEVRGGADNLQAMSQALDAVEADAVLIWPLCQETFSFVAYEAVAAGCAIVTGPDSGNVAAFVAEGEHGLVLDGEAKLHAAFQSGIILQLARAQRRPMVYDLFHLLLSQSGAGLVQDAAKASSKLGIGGADHGPSTRR